MKEHTEDCLDANDDTSVFKGKCICAPKGPTFTLCFYERIDGKLVETREEVTGSKAAAEKAGRQFAKERGIRFVRAFKNMRED